MCFFLGRYMHLTHEHRRAHTQTVYITSTSSQPQTQVVSSKNLTRNKHLASFLFSNAEMMHMNLPDANPEFIHNDRVLTETRSLCALQSHFHLVFTKYSFGNASFPLEELLHQLLSSAASPGRPQSGALPQAQRTQQPCIVQKRSLDEFMCSDGSRRTQHYV